MSCAAQPEEGLWLPPAPSNSITKVQVRFVCQDQVLNGHPYPPGPPFYVHLWGACEPTDCDWGEVGATRLTTGPIYAVYNQGFAIRHVYAEITSTGSLWVSVQTHFTDPHRADYAVDNWFVRQASPAAVAPPAPSSKKKVDKGAPLSAMAVDRAPSGSSVKSLTAHQVGPIPTVTTPA